MLNNSLNLTARAYSLKICRSNIFLEKKGPREIFVYLASCGEMTSTANFQRNKHRCDRKSLKFETNFFFSEWTKYYKKIVKKLTFLTSSNCQKFSRSRTNMLNHSKVAEWCILCSAHNYKRVFSETKFVFQKNFALMHHILDEVTLFYIYCERYFQ